MLHNAGPLIRKV